MRQGNLFVPQAHLGQTGAPLRLRLRRFRRFCLLQFLGDLFASGAVAAYAPQLRHQAIRKVISGARQRFL